ncbi:MAG: hypothetical protein AAB638_00765 [Patescibacteria group bacterium]
MRRALIGLGLVASGRRNIRPGTEYDSLYNKEFLLGTNPIIGGEASDTYDTLNHMAKIVLNTLEDTEKVAPTLQGRTLEETLRNDWNHVYNHFQYAKDANGIEQIRRPGRSWLDRKRGIDCDCMSVLLSSYLHHQKISHALRKAAYNESTGWQHVYVVVPKKGVPITDFTAKEVARNKYYVMDCVVDKFDHEVEPLKKFDKVMKIQYLNGLDQSTITGGITPQAFSLLAYPAPSSAEELLGIFGNEFNGLNGFNGESPRQVQTAFLLGLKQHLVNTRAILAINPALTAGIYNPAVFAQRLDSLIAVFDDGNTRSKVLNELACLEEREELNGLSGFGLGKGFFKKIAKGIKSVASKVGSGVKAAGAAIVQAAKVVAKVIVRYNPATIAIRNGLLLAMKLNLFRMAEKLGYGYWTEAQAQEKGLDIVEWRKNQVTLEKTRKLHKAIGGKVEKFDAAVKAGWAHGTKKHNLISGFNGFDGLGDRGNASKKAQAVKAKTTSQSKQIAAIKKQISPALPLLQLVDAQLKPIEYSALIRTQDASELEELLQAIRKNQNGLATKLSLAYKPVSEASTYNTVEYKKLLDRAKVVEKLVVSKGGTTQQLRDAVEAGKKIAITKASLGDPVSTTAAAGVLAAIAALLKPINFTTMFKGRASSPHASDAEIKSASVTAESTDDIDDEGDPNVTPLPISNIINSFAPTSILQSLIPKVAGSNPLVSKLTSSVTNAMAQSNPAVATLAKVLTSNPKLSSIASQIINAKSPTIAAALLKANPQAAPLVSAMKNNPVATEIASKSIAQENPILAKEISAAIEEVAPTAMQVAETLVQNNASPSAVEQFTKPGIVPVQNEEGRIVTLPIQEAEVVETKMLNEQKSNTVKYIAIAASVAVGVGLLAFALRGSKAAPAQIAQAAPAQVAAPALAGVKANGKKSKSKSSQRTKKVMAITI